MILYNLNFGEKVSNSLRPDYVIFVNNKYYNNKNKILKF